MLNWEELSAIEVFGLSAGYILGRAIFFYTLFHFLYKSLNHRLGIAKDLPSRNQLQRERLENIKVNLFEIGMFLLIGVSGIIKFHELTLFRFLATFLFCYFFFELWFYGTHRLLHTRGMLWAHKTHHVSVITNPLSALTMSLTEKSLNDVGMLIIPCALTNFLPFVFEGILAYHLYNFYINVLGHSNIELFPKWFSRSLTGKAFTTATYHSLHHLKGKKNFALFLTFLDRSFGTMDTSYDRHYESVVESRGLTRKELHESQPH